MRLKRKVEALAIWGVLFQALSKVFYRGSIRWDRNRRIKGLGAASMRPLSRLKECFQQSDRWKTREIRSLLRKKK